jgi:hypothetical protein
MTRPADRYVRRGCPVPQIYPGTLPGLQHAIKDCLTSSRLLPGRPVRLLAVYGRLGKLLRIFENGECTWMPDSQEETEP